MCEKIISFLPSALKRAARSQNILTTLLYRVIFSKFIHNNKSKVICFELCHFLSKSIICIEEMFSTYQFLHITYHKKVFHDFCNTIYKNSVLPNTFKVIDICTEYFRCIIQDSLHKWYNSSKSNFAM